jgi:hypothetical protein
MDFNTKITKSIKPVCLISLLVCLAFCPAFAQTNTYKWTNPVDNSTTILTLPSTWAFSGGVPAVSPDGTTSTPPGGAPLVTAAGKWTWGSAAAGRPGEYGVSFNGAAPSGIGNLMEINHGGKLYINTLHAGWFLWNGTAWVGSLAP